jgi:hypothetical protein
LRQNSDQGVRTRSSASIGAPVSVAIDGSPISGTGSWD